MRTRAPLCRLVLTHCRGPGPGSASSLPRRLHPAHRRGGARGAAGGAAPGAGAGAAPASLPNTTSGLSARCVGRLVGTSETASL